MIYVIDYEDYDFFLNICLNQDFQDYKMNRIKKRRHCGLDPQSPAKRYIVIASREARAAWQSRNISPFFCLNYDFFDYLNTMIKNK